MPRLSRLSSFLGQIKPVAIVVELLIVFVGVYLAFLLSEHRERRSFEQRRDRVIELLYEGVGTYEELFGGFELYHRNLNEDFRALLDAGQLPDYSEQVFIAPQYPIDVIDYVLTSESFDLFDLDLFIPLTQFANGVKRLMYAEEQMTSLADNFSPPASEGGSGSGERTQQHHEARRYLLYLESRRTIAGELADLAGQIREQLSPHVR